jgi:uncharacterized phosphosugar-binding protein
VKTSSTSLVDVFFDRVHAQLERFRNTQRDALARAAHAVAESLRRGGVLHLFGTGHSHMLAEEVFYRAGGLVPVNPMLDAAVILSGGAERSTRTERTPGAAARIAAAYDLRAGDAGVVISHSGRNPAPVEMAALMREKGLVVIAVTCLGQARGDGEARLAGIADVVLDTGGAVGDAAIVTPAALFPVGPTSTVAGAAILQALVLAVIEELGGSGEPVVNLPSANVPGADLEPVLRELQKRRRRIRHL